MSIQRALQLAFLLVLCACGSDRKSSGGTTPPPPPPPPPPPTGATAECTRCHGGPENAAPPKALSGATQVSDVAVGAHQRHLTGLTMRKPLACADCHVMPSEVTSPGHQDGQVTVVFDASGVARARGAQPAWNRESRTCSSVYCHGSTFMGAQAVEPVWTRTDGPKLWCGGCHGVPPPPDTGHPPSSACPQCHDTLHFDGTLDLEKHIDGVVQLAAGSCTACHGDPNRQPESTAAAPPLDTSGNTTSAKVGAHSRHLFGGATSGPVACESCHRLPGDAKHIDGSSAPEFGGVARAHSAQVSWDPTQRTCTNYCHGATLAGGTRTAPVWSGGPEEAACGSCHALPPTANHPAIQGSGATACTPCHPATARADGSVDVAGGKHVNGLVELDFTALGCASCHSGPLTGTDPDGVELAPAPGASPHVRHLGGGRARLRCRDCHGDLPTSMTHTDGTVQLSFRGIATGTQWNGTTCSTSYCHGDFRGSQIAGGAVVSWTTPSQPLGCTSCHHGQHYGDHSGGSECWICHEHVDSSGTAFIQPELHVNGRVDHMNCGIGCHQF